MNRFVASLVLATCLAAAGCNEASSGANGLVLFTPDECDVVGLGCSLDDSLAAGGTINVHIMGDDGISTAGFDLESDDPDVLAVTPVADVGGRPTWQLSATGAGVAHLYAVDANGDDVDFIDISVQEVDGLRLESFVGNAVGPTSDGEFDEIWTVNAGENVSFWVAPMAGTGTLIGRMSYLVEVDLAFLDAQVEGANLEAGYLYFNAAPGDYVVNITSDNGTPLDVLFEVR